MHMQGIFYMSSLTLSLIKFISAISSGWSTEQLHWKAKYNPPSAVNEGHQEEYEDDYSNQG